MQDLTAAWKLAWQLIASGDDTPIEIVSRSLQVSLLAVACASVIGLAVGSLVAVTRFPGRKSIIVFINALMGLPPVVVGLLVYLVLSRAGPLGTWGTSTQSSCTLWAFARSRHCLPCCGKGATAC